MEPAREMVRRIEITIEEQWVSGSFTSPAASPSPAASESQAPMQEEVPMATKKDSVSKSTARFVAFAAPAILFLSVGCLAHADPITFNTAQTSLSGLTWTDSARPLGVEGVSV